MITVPWNVLLAKIILSLRKDSFNLMVTSVVYIKRIVSSLKVSYYLLQFSGIWQIFIFSPFKGNNPNKESSYNFDPTETIVELL